MPEEDRKRLPFPISIRCDGHGSATAIRTVNTPDTYPRLTVGRALGHADREGTVRCTKLEEYGCERLPVSVRVYRTLTDGDPLLLTLRVTQCPHEVLRRWVRTTLHQERVHASRPSCGPRTGAQRVFRLERSAQIVVGVPEVGCGGR